IVRGVPGQLPATVTCHTRQRANPGIQRVERRAPHTSHLSVLRRLPGGRRTRPRQRSVFPREGPMSDKATMLQETVEAFADLRTMLDRLTEEQARRIRLGVLGVRDLMSQWTGMLRWCDGQVSQAAERAESVHKARMFCAPRSFWGLRYPGD